MSPTPPLDSGRHRPPYALLWLALLLALSSAWRAWLTQRALGASAGCEHCLLLPVAGHDAQLLAAAWALLAVAAILRSAWLRVALVLAVVVLMLLMAVDVAILTTLNMRLYLFDVFKFGMELDALRGFLLALLRSSGGGWLLAAIAGLCATLLALRPRPPHRGAAVALGAAAAAAATLALVSAARDPAYINADAYLNVVELHFAQGVNRAYSREFALRLARQSPAPEVHCQDGQSRRPDIIVLAVESLSSYQSELHGGPLALTPEIDAIARANTWFEAFHANGFTTDHGLIALLTGQAPVPAVGRYRSLEAFAGFDDPRHSVAVPLRAAGYQTAFFTTGDLGFLDKGPWLEALEIDHWEGAEHPFYAGWPRAGFNAAEDRALYLRLLQWMDEDARTSPWFAFVLTVQSHPPFVDPATGRLDEAGVFGAIDREVARFHAQLQERGFFRNGLLLITGDHRSMTPLHPAERASHGERAFARVPMIVVGDTGLPKGPVATPLQQTDLLPSLADLVSARSCRRADQGLFLRPEPVAPAWITHARGDARNRIDLYFADGSAALLLHGDESRWIGHQPAGWEAIAEGIHRDRMRRGPLDSDIEALVKILSR